MTKKNNQISIHSSAAEYLTYVASVGESSKDIEVRYEDENIWLTQKAMGLLYNVETNTINYHVKKIFADSELDESSTIRKFRIVQNEGERQIEREVSHYNLQMIICLYLRQRRKHNQERGVQPRNGSTEVKLELRIRRYVLERPTYKLGQLRNKLF